MQKGLWSAASGLSKLISNPFASGVVTADTVKRRGGKDYRLDAALTIHEFTEIILASVLYHNRFCTLEKYDRSIDMPADLSMTPSIAVELGIAAPNWSATGGVGRCLESELISPYERDAF